ncbi:MAG: hypothetical protein HKN53_04615 [Maribacter sp.]|nr:hypothetical protein [Maribacter sp.]
MKKVLVLVMLMAGFTAMAQKGERGHRGDFKDLSAEQMATLHTKKMTLDLDLTEAQQSKIKAFHLEKFKNRKAKMEKRQAQKDTSERPKLTSDEKYALRLERLDAAIAHKAELKKILSTEQFEKWEKHHKKRGEHHKGKGHHSKGKRGK